MYAVLDGDLEDSPQIRQMEEQPLGENRHSTALQNPAIPLINRLAIKRGF